MSAEEVSLKGLRILVVEDDYLVATALAGVIESQGAEVLGPVGNVRQALALIAGGVHIDAALLDINLRSETVYPVAELLRTKRVPMVFTTGYESADLPREFSGIPTLQKPVTAERLLQTLRGQIRSADASQRPRE